MKDLPSSMFALSDVFQLGFPLGSTVLSLNFDMSAAHLKGVETITKTFLPYQKGESLDLTVNGKPYLSPRFIYL